MVYKLTEEDLAYYWDLIPIGREQAYKYGDLCDIFHCTERTARAILQQLSSYDNGDDFVLIRSSNGAGFYKTSNLAEIEAYKKECLHRGRSVMAAVSKCNRLLKVDPLQCNLFNKLFCDS